MKKIIVTGGLGFIGSNLIETLLKKNYYVLNLDKVSYSSNFYNTKEFKQSKKYKFLKCDIGDKKLKKILFKYKPNGIFNLAAETHVDRSIDGPKNFIQSNIVGTFNLLELARKNSNLKKFIQISTDEVYGNMDDYDKTVLANESFPLVGSSYYSSTKASTASLTDGTSWRFPIPCPEPQMSFQAFF